jgi:hypothetical protein
MKTYLEYKAGPAILDMIREEGLKPERVRVFAGPAGGPKWFVSVGFDKALIKSRLLERGNRVLLAGVRWRVEVPCHGLARTSERMREFKNSLFSEHLLQQDTPASVYGTAEEC